MGDIGENTDVVVVIEALLDHLCMVQLQRVGLSYICASA